MTAQTEKKATRNSCDRGDGQRVDKSFSQNDNAIGGSVSD